LDAPIRITVRKIWISLAQGDACPSIFTQVFANLEEAKAPGG
jgi:hypothetical protein